MSSVVSWWGGGRGDEEVRKQVLRPGLDSPEETGLESVGRYHSESRVYPLRVV